MPVDRGTPDLANLHFGRALLISLALVVMFSAGVLSGPPVAIQVVCIVGLVCAMPLTVLFGWALARFAGDG